MKKYKILVVDDEKSIRLLCKKVLEKEGYIVDEAGDGETAVRMGSNEYDLVLLDLKLPGMDGITVMDRIKEKYTSTRVIIFTGYPTLDTSLRAIKKGVFDYILKPFNVADLVLSVKRCFASYNFPSGGTALNAIDALCEVSKVMGSLSDIRSILNIILVEAMKAANGDSGSIMILNERTQELEIKAFLGLKEEIARTMKIKIGHGIAGRVARDGNPILLIDGLKQYAEFQNLRTRPEIKSAIIVPLKIKDKIMGILNVNNTEVKDKFTENDLRMMGIFAADASVIIKNSSLLEETKVYAKQLEGKIEELNEVYKKLKDSQEQIIRTEKLRMAGEFAASIAHELRNPLGIISSTAQFMLDKLSVKPKIKQHLDVMLRNSERANKKVQNFLEFARPSEISPKPSSIEKVLDDMCELIDTRCRKQKVNIIKRYKPGLPLVVVDGKHIESAFLNFMLNSIDAMKEGGRITIETGMDKQKENILIRFTDSGCGIPEDRIDRIFEPFFTTKSTGTGLGLSIARKIIDQYAGKITVESRKGQGTTVSVYLPVAGELI